MRYFVLNLFTTNCKGMLIIFCNINGVLNSNTEIDFKSQDGLDKELISNLNKLILTHGAKLVLTAPWKEQSEFFSMGKLLYENGLIQDSILSALPKNINKLDGLMIWLQTHDKFISNFIVIDGDFKEITNTPLNEKFVKTNSNIGLDSNALAEANKKISS